MDSEFIRQPVPIVRNKPVSIGVGEEEREGVFVNGFICQNCGLHFNLFSWKANKHRANNTYCPECGKKGPYIHYRKVLSKDRVRDDNSIDEIFRHVPWPGSQLINDSVIFSSESKK